MGRYKPNHPRRPRSVAPDGCPDCTATQELTQYSPGVMILEIRHDNTCPTYRAMQEEN